MALHPTIRKMVCRVATQKSSVNLLKRSKLAFTKLEKRHPDMMKDYTPEKLYANVCNYRRSKGLSKKRLKKHAAAKAARRSRGLGVVDLVTFINVNKATIVAMTKIDPKIVSQYERIRAEAKKGGLEIVVKDDEVHLVPMN
jgi:hypothetical protein